MPRPLEGVSKRGGGYQGRTQEKFFLGGGGRKNFESPLFGDALFGDALLGGATAEGLGGWGGGAPAAGGETFLNLHIENTTGTSQKFMERRFLPSKLF